MVFIHTSISAVEYLKWTRVKISAKSVLFIIIPNKVLNLSYQLFNGIFLHRQHLHVTDSHLLIMQQEYQRDMPTTGCWIKPSAGISLQRVSSLIFASCSPILACHSGSIYLQILELPALFKYVCLIT